MLSTQTPSVTSRGINRWSSGTLAAFLVLCGVLPYLNALSNGFVYDDNTQVLKNPYIYSFRFLREIFTTTVWSYIGQRGTNYYRPMMTFGYLVCYQLFGPVAYGFHLASVLIHATVVCLVYLVTERMFQKRGVALASAVVFALHPIHTESVAWIAAVTDLELTLFYLLTFWFFLGAGLSSARGLALAKLGMVGSFVLALLSKEQAMTLPLLATVYEHFYRADRAETSWREKVSRYFLLWLLGGAYFLFRAYSFGAFVPILRRPDLTWFQSVLTAVVLVKQYLWKLVWPAELCAFYVFRKSTSLLDPQVVAGLGILLLVLVIFLRLSRNARPVSFALLWLMATLVPVLNARWLAAGVFTERYLYLPSVGFSWLVASGIVGLWSLAGARGLAWRRGLAAVLGSLVGLATARIIVRNREWRDEIILYTRTLEVQPDAWPIRNNLGGAYWNRGDARGAEAQWLAALQIKQDNQVVLSNMGLLCSKAKRYSEAVQYFQRALTVDPRLTDAHMYLGDVHRELGETKLAELQFRDAVAISPLNIQARNRLGELDASSGRWDEAEEQFTRSLESQPNATAYDGLGDVATHRNDARGAQRFYTRALEVDPFDSHAHFKLGGLYARAGRKAEALREFNAGFDTDPKNAEARAAVKKLEAQPPDAPTGKK